MPSSVPKGVVRRRESIGGPGRTPTITAAGGGTGSISFQRSNGQTIPPLTSRIAISPRLGPTSAGIEAGNAGTASTGVGAIGVGSLPTSLGAAAEALSMSSKFGSHSFTTSTGGLVAKPSERSTGHTHFGQECFGPQPGDPTTTTAPPLHSMLTKENMQKNNSRAAGTGAGQRRNSFSSVATDDDKGSLSSSNQLLHKCEACSKVYRHPSCLVKHRWEHTVYWKEASKFLMSKHQQVQLLEAAAILVGMDTNARSLPEEKALWPAAVSPPSSGLLGSDKINFEKLLAQKSARASQSPVLDRTTKGPVAPSNEGSRLTTASPLHATSSLPAQAASLSPLHSFTRLNLGKYARNGDVGHLQLDESAERSVREESVETEDEDDEDREEDEMEGDESMTGSTTVSTGSPSRETEERERERYGLGAGGDVLAEMEMEGVE